MVEEIAVGGVDGFTTYRLSINLGDEAFNVHTIFGTPDTAMIVPPAYQADGGASIGGIDPAFVAIQPNLAYDSWLTIGETGGAASGILSTTISGAELASWGPTTGLTVTNGAVSYFGSGSDPSSAPAAGSPIVVAQLTVPSTTSTVAVM